MSAKYTEKELAWAKHLEEYFRSGNYPDAQDYLDLMDDIRAEERERCALRAEDVAAVAASVAGDVGAVVAVAKYGRLVADYIRIGEP